MHTERHYALDDLGAFCDSCDGNLVSAGWAIARLFPKGTLPETDADGKFPDDEDYKDYIDTTAYLSAPMYKAVVDDDISDAVDILHFHADCYDSAVNVASRCVGDAYAFRLVDG